MSWFAEGSRASQRVELAGERGAPSIALSRSLQARLTSVLTIAIALGTAAAALIWYYHRTATRPVRLRQSAQAASASRAQGDAPLPSLGPIEAPAAPVMAAADPVAAPIAVAPMPDMDSRSIAKSLPVADTAQAAATVTAPTDRRLTGEAFIAATTEGASMASPPPSEGTAAPPVKDSLSSLLHSAPEVQVHAHVLGNSRLLLPKGAFLDCTLQTAIDSTLPGMTTCITATDTFGADGSVVLLDRGTKLVGETRGQVQQGQARLFVLWTEARTPAGVVVPLDSPGADELGRSGVAGAVERHFWERFGAALLISSVEGAAQAAIQDSSRNGGALIYNPSATQDVATEALKSSVNIGPTVIKPQGDRIQVLVARDVDFSQVYELRHVDAVP